MSFKVGILALQGAFSEHASVLSSLGARPSEVRLPEDLKGLDGLIVPGGESTTISRLMEEYRLFPPLQQMASSGFPMMGTCAGLIMLGRTNPNTWPHTLQAMDVVVRRNAFGRQVDSFEADLSLPVLGDKPFPGVFIRAPRVESVGAAATVLCRLDGGKGVVAARQGNLLGCSFHPELSSDSRFHQYFLDMVRAAA